MQCKLLVSTWFDERLARLLLNVFDQLRLIVTGLRYKSLFASVIINIGLHREGLF